MNTERVFFTINDGNHVRNPHSMVIIEAIKTFGYGCMILNSTTELELLNSRLVMVALFDSNAGGRLNHWRPVFGSDVIEPSWVRPAHWAIKVSRRCVETPMAIERAARQIPQISPPWGPPRISKRKRHHTPLNFFMWR